MKPEESFLQLIQTGIQGLVRAELERVARSKGSLDPLRGAEPPEQVAVRRFLESLEPGRYAATALYQLWGPWAASEAPESEGITITMFGRRVVGCTDLVRRVKDGKSWYIVFPRPAAVAQAGEADGPSQPSQPSVAPTPWGAYVEVSMLGATGEGPGRHVGASAGRATPVAPPAAPKLVLGPVERWLEAPGTAGWIGTDGRETFELFVRWRVWALDQPEGQNCVSEAEFGARLAASGRVERVGRGSWRVGGGGAARAAQLAAET
jgi:hypothetical protein